jgi:hypothetical protein
MDIIHEKAKQEARHSVAFEVMDISFVVAVVSWSLEQRCSKHRASEQTSSNRQTRASAVPVPIWPSVRSGWSDDAYVGVRVGAVGVGIVTVTSARCVPAPGWLDVHFATLLVFAQELRLAGLDGFYEGLSCAHVGEVGLAFLLCATDAMLFALFVRLAGDFVFEFARELGETCGLGSGTRACCGLGSWRQFIVVGVLGS